MFQNTLNGKGKSSPNVYAIFTIMKERNEIWVGKTRRKMVATLLPNRPIHHISVIYHRLHSVIRFRLPEKNLEYKIIECIYLEIRSITVLVIYL